MEKESACFRIIKGTIPVLVSAPHVFAHRRPSLTMSYKTGEQWTDSIVEEICANTGAWGILLTSESEYDPNYHCIDINEYKNSVRNLIVDNKIKKFVDIHGLSDEHDYDLAVYYPSKFTNSIKLAEDICRSVDVCDLQGINLCVLRFLDNEQETLGEFVASKLRVPSIQMEIARYIREKQKLRNCLIENISKYLRV